MGGVTGQVIAGRPPLHALPVAAALGRPVALAGERILPVDAPLLPLLAEGGLRRGCTVAVRGAASTSLALALLPAASQAGSWAAVLGLPHLGLVAAAQSGVDLDRLVLVPSPGDQWPVAAAALLESADVLIVGVPSRVRPADARRLGARARERGAVLVLAAGEGPVAWPEPADLCLAVDDARWEGLGAGHGHLRARRAEVTATGRRGASRPRHARLWLPGPDGRVVAVAAEPVTDRMMSPVAVGT